MSGVSRSGFVTHNGSTIGEMNKTDCASKYATEQRLWRSGDGYGFSTNNLSFGYNCSWMNTVTNTSDGASRYSNNKLQMASIGYKLALGTIKDNAHYEKGAKFTCEFGASGGVCYPHDTKISDPSYQYKGDVRLKHEDAVAGPGFMKGLSLTWDMGTSHTGVINKSNKADEAVSQPDKISVTDVDMNFGMKGNIYPYADVYAKVGGGYQFINTTTDGQKTSFNEPFAQGEVGTTILIPVQNSVVTPAISLYGRLRYGLYNVVHKDTDFQGNPMSGEVGTTLTLKLP